MKASEGECDSEEGQVVIVSASEDERLNCESRGECECE